MLADTENDLRLGHLEAVADRNYSFLDDDTFVQTPAISAAMSESRPFICGRKGAGKTAVAFRLSETKTFANRIEIEEHEYADLHTVAADRIHVLPEFQDNATQSLEVIYYWLWTLILHLCAIHGITALAPKLRPAEKELHDELCNLYKQINPRNRHPVALGRATLRAALQRAQGQSAGVLEISHALSTAITSGKVSRAKEIASLLSLHLPIYVSIDTLEKYDTSIARIMPMRGMCRSVREFCERRYYPGLMIKCFLPAELKDRIFYENKFKYEDLSTVLRWEYSDLIEFVARRYSRLLRQFHSGPNKELGHKLKLEIDRLKDNRDRQNSSWQTRVWNLFAPSTIKNRNDDQEDGPTYFLRHTQRRPRECLSAMNHIVVDASTHESFPFLSSRAIQAGIHNQKNLEDILNSAVSIYGFGSTLSPLQKLVGQVFSGENPVFRANLLKNMTARVASEFIDRSRIEVQEYLQELLLRGGLLGVVQRRTRPTNMSRLIYCITKFDYGDTDEIAWNETSEFALHPVLADCFGIKSAAGSREIILPVTEKPSIEGQS